MVNSKDKLEKLMNLRKSKMKKRYPWLCLKKKKLLAKKKTGLLTETNNIFNYIFCKSIKHKSHVYLDAQKMTFEAKKQLLIANNYCFTGFRVGHINRRCRYYVRCSKCSKIHYLVVCPTLMEKK